MSLQVMLGTQQAYLYKHDQTKLQHKARPTGFGTSYCHLLAIAVQFGYMSAASSFT